MPGLVLRTCVNVGEASSVQLGSRAQSKAHARAHAVYQKRLASARTIFLTA